MFIIRAKRRKAGDPDWLLMKTPLGPLPVAFVAAEDAQAYLAASGADAFCEARGRESLLRSDPAALENATHLLLIPSLKVTRSFLRDPLGFPYGRYVVPMPARPLPGLSLSALRRPHINAVAITAGVILIMFALTYSLVPVASNDYRGVLKSALVCAAAAIACLAVPASVGPNRWRVAAIVAALPALFVVADFCRRAQGVFDGR